MLDVNVRRENTCTRETSHMGVEKDMVIVSMTSLLEDSKEESRLGQSIASRLQLDSIPLEASLTGTIAAENDATLKGEFKIQVIQHCSFTSLISETRRAVRDSNETLKRCIYERAARGGSCTWLAS
ncbi:hypothetical protein ACLOJK_026624 [Asimina triloba]